MVSVAEPAEVGNVNGLVRPWVKVSLGEQGFLFGLWRGKWVLL